MTELTLRERGLVVVDGVLAAPSFAALADEIANGDYKGVHAQRWDKAWRLWDGNPQRGESVSYDPGGVLGAKGAAYPTATSVDALIDAVRRTAAAAPDVVGVEGVDWIGLYLAPWLYPVGSALSLHRDAERYSGSFTFFAHTRWSVHWGGELMVSHAPEPATRGDAPWISEDGLDDDPGVWTGLTPRPNRLVLLGPDRPHRIARVDANAGARVRASVAGFFLRPPER